MNVSYPFVSVATIALTLCACSGDGNSTPSGTTTATSSATTTATTTQPTSSGGLTTSTQQTDSGASSGGTDTEETTGSPPVACPYSEVAGQPDLTPQLVATGFSQPVLAVGDPVEHDVIYVVEKFGDIKRIEPGVTKAPAETWFAVPGVNSSANERGLLGFAFHPNYPEDGRIYVAFTESNNALLVAEYPVNDGVVDANGGRPIIGMPEPASNHNGGMIQFGPDGMLYVSVGDGGFADNSCGAAQDNTQFLGKILRINPDADGTPDPAPTQCGTCQCNSIDYAFDYTIPADNPFVGDPSVHDAIYATGVRNGWRFSFDPEDGQLFVADVGQDAREEVDVVQAGDNLGWSTMEGLDCFPLESDQCSPSAPGTVNNAGLRMPIAAYPLTGGRCAIIGLGNYRSCEVPAWDGRYFYADLCSGEVFGVSYDGTTITEHGVLAMLPGSAFGGGYNAFGDVFITLESFAQGGAVYRIGPPK